VEMKTLCVVLISLWYIVSCQPDCSRIPNPQGSGYYNLQPIVGKELELKDSFSTYIATICTNTYDDCGLCGGPAGFCQYTQFWADCIGRFSAAVVETNQQAVRLHYDNGDWGASGIIKLQCDPSAGDLSTPVPENNNYKVMVVKSKHACLISSSCSSQPNCKDCSSPSCAWCLDNSACVFVNSTSCRNTIKDPTYCPLPCDSHKDCDSCTKGRCAWCLDTTDKCVKNDEVSQCKGVVRDPIYCSPTSEEVSSWQ